MWPCHLEQNNVHCEKLYNDPSIRGETLTLLFLLNRRDENLYRFETTMYIYMSCFVIYLNIRGKNIRRTNDQTKMIFTRYKHERIYFIVSIDAISFRYACMVTKLLSIEIQVT